MKSVISALTESMRQECNILAEFHESETTMKVKIHEKDWDSLETIIDRMSELADSLVEVDTSRQTAFDEIKTRVGESSAAGFYQVIVHLPFEDRNVLSDLYRMMKASVFGIQAVTYCMDAHVRTLNDTIHGILGELYPHRKGSIYSKKGQKLQSGSNPILLNKEL